MLTPLWSLDALPYPHPFLMNEEGIFLSSYTFVFGVLCKSQMTDCHGQDSLLDTINVTGSELNRNY